MGICELDLVKTMKKTEQPMERTAAIIIKIRIFTGELDHNGGLLDHFFADPVDPPASIMAKWLLASLSGSLGREKGDKEKGEVVKFYETLVKHW